MNARDDKGRFTVGNPFASLGGQRRATLLTPDRRRAIAAAGFRAMCAKHYGSDVSAAGRAIAQRGNGPDVIYFGHTFKHEVQHETTF